MKKFYPSFNKNNIHGVNGVLMNTFRTRNTFVELIDSIMNKKVSYYQDYTEMLNRKKIT